MAQFSERLKQLRKERHILQKDIAAYLGVQPRNIRFYESGERCPDFQGLVALADFFQVSLDYLTARSSDPTIHSPTIEQGEEAGTPEEPKPQAM